MKRVLLLIVFVTLVTGCNKSIEDNSSNSVGKSTTKEVTTTTKKYSDRFNNFSKLIKSEMVKKKFIDESNLKSFEIIEIYINGYYAERPKKFHYQINFNYECNDNTYNCIDYLYMEKPNSNNRDYFVIWVYGNEGKIDDLSGGISINMNDNYVVVGETIK